MSFFYDFLNSFWSFFQELLSWALDGIIYIFQLCAYVIFDALLRVIEWLITAIDFGFLTTFNFAEAWLGLPPQIIWFVNAIGLPQVLTLLASAYGVRMLLNLIPAAFTRI